MAGEGNCSQAAATDKYLQTGADMAANQHVELRMGLAYVSI